MRSHERSPDLILVKGKRLFPIYSFVLPHLDAIRVILFLACETTVEEAVGNSLRYQLRTVEI